VVNISEQLFIQTQYFTGKIGITLNVGWAEPEDPYNPDYLEASERDIQFNLGWFAHPILVNGNYPQVMIDRIGNNSNGASRLPKFSDISRINGKCAFHSVENVTDMYF
jgi:lactase-phlorizin hydrolase